MYSLDFHLDIFEFIGFVYLIGFGSKLFFTKLENSLSQLQTKCMKKESQVNFHIHIFFLSTDILKFYRYFFKDDAEKNIQHARRLTLGL